MTSTESISNEAVGEGLGKEKFIPDTTFRDGRERGLRINEVMCNFKSQDLADKVVLELGSGEEEKFASELKTELAKIGKTATVFCLNPDYINNPEYRERIAKIHEERGEISAVSVAGIAQRLPFENESIDEIIANHSLTAFVSPQTNPEGAEMWAEEIIRVLKPGGQARITPVTPRHFVLEGYDKLIRIWKDGGLEVEVYNIKTVDILGEYREWLEPPGNLRREKIDPNESFMSTLILKKPDNL